MTTATIVPEIEQCPEALDTRVALIEEVETGLTSSPRTLSPWMFYDAYGSHLFERITELPEYYPARIERDLLGRFAPEILEQVRPDSSHPLRVFELGAGTAAKTGLLLKAAMPGGGRVTYAPCDVSPSALDVASTSIESLLPGVELQPVVSNYVTDPPQLTRCEGSTLALYIGSSIGNFSPSAARTILRNLSSQLHPGDSLLLGTDMVKDVGPLVAAYDDREGVTAEFNLNILRRLNRELRADFNLSGFRHRVRWNRPDSRIEMHLESLYEQHVRIPGADLSVHFANGETIHTENSHKFTRPALAALLEDAGFTLKQTWTDPLKWYALTLGGVR